MVQDQMHKSIVMIKRGILQFLTLVMLLFFFSCGDSTKTKDKAIVSGTVAVVNEGEIRLSNEPIPLENEWSSNMDTTGVALPVDEEGRFRFEIEIEKPSFYRVNLGKENVLLYVSPNDSIAITLDSLVNLAGTNAHLNTYLQHQKEEIGKAEGYIYRNLASLYALDEASFRKQLDSLKNANFAHYNTFSSSVENIPAVFEKHCMVTLDNHYKYYQLLYPSGHEIVTGKTAQLPKDYLEEMASGLNKPESLNDEKYIAYLDKYVEIMSSGKFKNQRYDNQPLEKINARYLAIKNLPVDQEIKDYLFEQHFKICNTNYSTKAWKGIVTQFEKEISNEQLLAKVKNDYQKALAVREEPNEIRVYKTTNEIGLDAHIFYPEEHKQEDKRSVYLYFHGGGWSLGMPEAGYDVCKRMSKQGMVAISFEYRLIDVHGNDIQKSLEDAKSAIRWVRANASELGIDPSKIVATGFSAGAHLAASTAIVVDFVSKDNNGFSSVPNLVITQSSSYDLTKGDGWFDGVSKGQAQAISLVQNVKSGLPPFLSFHTTEDYLAPIYEFFQFKAAMEGHKNDFQFQIFEKGGHFFRDKKAREKVKELTDEFLVARGFLGDSKK